MEKTLGYVSILGGPKSMPQSIAVFRTRNKSDCNLKSIPFGRLVNVANLLSLRQGLRLSLSKLTWIAYIQSYGEPPACDELLDLGDASILYSENILEQYGLLNLLAP